ncbi:transcriptional regulator, XRE family [Hyphomicrobium denitrificans ATCC 51888]|uniref:Transcriptional regulator, XRE family n=1 Tax=Hyphomicrobium denitrificans (strain ATCC 51888 / DSM 1869 / NCIMB 11706 / TK 0415) TaxID=582899 RepID=D8JVG7_HYPDA|nr:helix-turn-helix transcriptional regulator [Hyphomicrobium denitrificans]ADJ24821.1 transcriptional regulator, XRE family [Hyphomicrobium denitrificans ATCC 51888]
MDRIRKNLADGLKQKDMSMAELSRRLGRNDAYVQQFISGKQQSIPYEERILAAEILDMSPDLLDAAHQMAARAQPTEFREDATLYVPKPGHFLSTMPKHYLSLKQESTSLDQHPERIRKGDVMIFDLNASDPAKIPPLTIVAVQLCSRKELTKSLGTATLVFIPPNKLITNSSEFNEIISMDDETLPYVPVIRGSFVSVIREIN